jgi:S-adenosylmethionine:tRNA ribosyltransferase-isomerase
MKKSDLYFEYPDELVALSPQNPSRILLAGDFKQSKPQEINKEKLFNFFNAGDVVVINNTKVLKRRVFAENKEILFLNQNESNPLQWQVLMPSKDLKIKQEFELPLGVKAKLVEKGRPQIIETNTLLTEKYFEQTAQLPLPPYIQKLRDQRTTQVDDEKWYQTKWASKPGSLAAPTASFHFDNKDWDFLRQKGVKVLEITLHVGLGTFLPVVAEDLKDHKMHEELVDIPSETWNEVLKAKKEKRKIIALGTTVCRSLESQGRNFFAHSATSDSLIGSTNLFITPGFKFEIVDVLLTNFHQPESTLLALVAAFSDLETVKKNYQFAIENKFRLFSYGDLSVWL